MFPLCYLECPVTPRSHQPFPACWHTHPQMPTLSVGDVADRARVNLNSESELSRAVEKGTQPPHGRRRRGYLLRVPVRCPLPSPVGIPTDLSTRALPCQSAPVPHSPATSGDNGPPLL